MQQAREAGSLLQELVPQVQRLAQKESLVTEKGQDHPSILPDALHDLLQRLEQAAAPRELAGQARELRDLAASLQVLLLRLNAGRQDTPGLFLPRGENN